MPASQDMTISLDTNQTYHIFNRGINRQLIFFKKDNYIYFIGKYREYMASYYNTYAWVLMPNHFHFVVQVKSANEIISVLKRDFKKVGAAFSNKHGPLIKKLSENLKTEAHPKSPHLEGHNQAPDLTSLKVLLNLANGKSKDPRSQLLLETLVTWAISERFRRFLLGYAKAINKQQNRTGSLFQKTFRRKTITSKSALINVICYVHHNPIHHGFVHSYDQYQWSSYNSYFNNNMVIDFRNKATNFFGGLDEMKARHEVYKTQYKEKVDQANLGIEA